MIYFSASFEVTKLPELWNPTSSEVYTLKIKNKITLKENF